jgi:hypothetical protein
VSWQAGYPVVVDLAGLSIPTQNRPLRFGHDNKNYLEDADTVLSIDGLTKAEVAFMDQVDSDGKPQADTDGISDVQFAELLESDALLSAHDALLEELADFFRKLRQVHMATAIQKQAQIVAEAIRRADDVIRAVELEEATGSIPDPPQEAPGSSAADSRPSPDVTPASEPSGS